MDDKNNENENNENENEIIKNDVIIDEYIEYDMIKDNDSINKTIYMTYKKEVPEFVFTRWLDLNPNFKIDFNLDNDCINFLEKEFGNSLSFLFKYIKEGMYKADLWRLCKLYIHTGVYSDVDLVPYIDIDSLDNEVTFYSCMAVNEKSIFQAFMINNSTEKSPLFAACIISMIANRAWYQAAGPTYDMYDLLKYNTVEKIVAGTKYYLHTIKVPITIGNSLNNIKKIELFWLPDDIEYDIKIVPHNFKDNLEISIDGSTITVKRIDKDQGWGHHHKLEIIMKCNECFYLFQEEQLRWSGKPKQRMASCIVSDKNKKILDSRDPIYTKNDGW